MRPRAGVFHGALGHHGSFGPRPARIVHHALHRQLALALDRKLVDTTFACLPGRGSHRAVLAFQRALRRHRYVLLLDIARYFPSVDGRRLQALLASMLKDRRILELFARIIDTGTELYARPEARSALGLAPDDPGPGCGLPIGNLTSQWWANHYLSGLDHGLLRGRGAPKLPAVHRYMDDSALFSDRKNDLEAARAWAIEWLLEARGLRLKNPEAPVRSTREAFTYLGYRVDRRQFELGARAWFEPSDALAISSGAATRTAPIAAWPPTADGCPIRPDGVRRSEHASPPSLPAGQEPT